MIEYFFGIIDESADEILDIERTILINKPTSIAEEQIHFFEFELSEDAKKLSKEVSDAVIDSISAGSIQSLIIDYKIIVQSELVEGTEIFKKISSLVPKFPLVLLTNVPNACYQKEYVDADKVYSKQAFFKVDEDYSKQKTYNLFKNIENYCSVRSRLDVSLQEALISFEESGYTQAVFQRIIELEQKLNEYSPQELSRIEEALDINELQEAVRLIQEANELLGETNED